jgi:hypothetical protein
MVGRTLEAAAADASVLRPGFATAHSRCCIHRLQQSRCTRNRHVAGEPNSIRMEMR